MSEAPPTPALIAELRAIADESYPSMKSHLRDVADRLERATADALRSLPAALEDSRILRQGCIVEIACCNDSKSVLDYMNHWEPRALAAEAQVARLTADTTLLELLTSSRSPCGHWSSHAYSPDGKGKQILCLDCEVARLTQERDTAPLAELLTSLLDRIEGGRRCSIGSIDNVRRVDFNVDEIARFRQLAALAQARDTRPPPPDLEATKATKSDE